MRQHLQVAAQQLGYQPDELKDAPELPPLMADLWGFFYELHMRRSSNGYGPNPISFTELDAWSRVRRIPLSRFDVDAIMALDAVYFVHRNSLMTGD